MEESDVAPLLDKITENLLSLYFANLFVSSHLDEIAIQKNIDNISQFKIPPGLSKALNDGFALTRESQPSFLIETMGQYMGLFAQFKDQPKCWECFVLISNYICTILAHPIQDNTKNIIPPQNEDQAHKKQTKFFCLIMDQLSEIAKGFTVDSITIDTFDILMNQINTEFLILFMETNKSKRMRKSVSNFLAQLTSSYPLCQQFSTRYWKKYPEFQITDNIMANRLWLNCLSNSQPQLSGPDLYFFEDFKKNVQDVARPIFVEQFFNAILGMLPRLKLEKQDMMTVWDFGAKWIQDLPLQSVWFLCKLFQFGGHHLYHKKTNFISLIKEYLPQVNSETISILTEYFRYMPELSEFDQDDVNQEFSYEFIDAIFKEQSELVVQLFIGVGAHDFRLVLQVFPQVIEQHYPTCIEVLIMLARQCPHVYDNYKIDVSIIIEPCFARNDIRILELFPIATPTTPEYFESASNALIEHALDINSPFFPVFLQSIDLLPQTSCLTVLEKLFTELRFMFDPPVLLQQFDRINSIIDHCPNLETVQESAETSLLFMIFVAIESISTAAKKLLQRFPNTELYRWTQNYKIIDDINKIESRARFFSPLFDVFQKFKKKMPIEFFRCLQFILAICAHKGDKLYKVLFQEFIVEVQEPKSASIYHMIQDIDPSLWCAFMKNLSKFMPYNSLTYNKMWPQITRIIFAYAQKPSFKDIIQNKPLFNQCVAIYLNKFYNNDSSANLSFNLTFRSFSIIGAYCRYSPTFFTDIDNFPKLIQKLIKIFRCQESKSFGFDYVMSFLDALEFCFKFASYSDHSFFKWVSFFSRTYTKNQTIQDKVSRVLFTVLKNNLTNFPFYIECAFNELDPYAANFIQALEIANNTIPEIIPMCTFIFRGKQFGRMSQKIVDRMNDACPKVKAEMMFSLLKFYNQYIGLQYPSEDFIRNFTARLSDVIENPTQELINDLLTFSEFALKSHLHWTYIEKVWTDIEPNPYQMILNFASMNKYISCSIAIGHLFKAYPDEIYNALISFIKNAITQPRYGNDAIIAINALSQIFILIDKEKIRKEDIPFLLYFAIITREVVELQMEQLPNLFSSLKIKYSVDKSLSVDESINEILNANDIGVEALYQVASDNAMTIRHGPTLLASFDLIKTFIVSYSSDMVIKFLSNSLKSEFITTSLLEVLQVRLSHTKDEKTPIFLSLLCYLGIQGPGSRQLLVDMIIQLCGEINSAEISQFSEEFGDYMNMKFLELLSGDQSNHANILKCLDLLSHIINNEMLSLASTIWQGITAFCNDSTFTYKEWVNELVAKYNDEKHSSFIINYFCFLVKNCQIHTVLFQSIVLKVLGQYIELTQIKLEQELANNLLKFLLVLSYTPNSNLSRLALEIDGSVLSTIDFEPNEDVINFVGFVPSLDSEKLVDSDQLPQMNPFRNYSESQEGCFSSVSKYLESFRP